MVHLILSEPWILNPKPCSLSAREDVMHLIVSKPRTLNHVSLPAGKDVVHLIVSRTASGSSVRFAAAFAATHILWSRQAAAPAPAGKRPSNPVSPPLAKRPRLTSPGGADLKSPTAAEMKPALVE